MTSNAVTLKAIDAALISKYTGISINTGDPPAPTSVTAFIETPDPEKYPERVYPSVAIKFLSMTPDYAAIVESDDLEQEETAYDDVADPPERSMRQRPLPFRILYSIDTWHKARVGESRDLLYETFLNRTNPRGYLTVQNIDSAAVTVWMFWQNGPVSLDENHIDEVIYHKSLRVVVLAYLSLVDSDDVVDEKVATELNLKVSSRHTMMDDTGFHIDDSKNVEDIEIRVTDTETEVIP